MANLQVTPSQEKAVKAEGFLRNRGTDNFSARIITINGKITAAQQRIIADAAGKFGNGDVLFTSRLTIEVPGIPYEKINEFQDFIAKEDLVTGGTGSKVRPVVSCKGTVCSHGLIDTFDLSEEIHNRFYIGYRTVLLPHKFKIAVGGCPNNCVKPTLNDLGIVGQMVPNYDSVLCMGCKKCSVEAACPIGAAKVVDGLLEISNDCNNCGKCIGKCNFDAIPDGEQGYQISIGGMWGKRTQAAKALNKIFKTPEEVYNTIEKMILLYREQGQTGERVAQTVNRIGFENIEAELLSDEIIERKDKILNAELHITGGATC
ncbi:MAG TPA: (4Fe-4S)-binding protein [Clostridiales bacterium]|nr:(4Fe-4S)-binding protein [Clostridiales bacterium]